MAETANIAEIAAKISKDIFFAFKWSLHPKRDDNFQCVAEKHKAAGRSQLGTKTHPGDAVFFYTDPYLGKQIYLHTDLKSYGAQSITANSVRAALKSLATTIECANTSADWRQKYSVDASESHEVRGLLFVYNHDKGYEKDFGSLIRQVNLGTLPIAPNTILHFLGPEDILRLYAIANDMMRLQAEKTLSSDYTFYYPDLVLSRRHGDVWAQPAMIESLTGPYIIVRHRGVA